MLNRKLSRTEDSDTGSQMCHSVIYDVKMKKRTDIKVNTRPASSSDKVIRVVVVVVEFSLLVAFKRYIS